MLCCVVLFISCYGSSSLHCGHHRCSNLLLSIFHSKQRLSVPVQCWVMISLSHQEYTSVPAMSFFILNFYIQDSDVKSLLSKSSALPSSLKVLTVLWMVLSGWAAGWADQVAQERRSGVLRLDNKDCLSREPQLPLIITLGCSVDNKLSKKAILTWANDIFHWNCKQQVHKYMMMSSVFKKIIPHSVLLMLNVMQLSSFNFLILYSFRSKWLHLEFL